MISLNYIFFVVIVTKSGSDKSNKKPRANEQLRHPPSAQKKHHKNQNYMN